MIVAGVDEAGRGPLFGPVVAGAVVLTNDVEGINDSKKLTAKSREKLFFEILKNSFFGIGIATPAEIDKLNILHATELAMNRALDMLRRKVDFDLVLVDGKNLKLKYLYKCIIKGDLLVKEISAASIVAKVIRDRILNFYSKRFSNYLFERHKGYPTKLHIDLIEKYGLTPEHRLTFKPVVNLIKINELEEWYKSGIIDEERYRIIVKKMGVPLFGI
ncbi:ribonuclease HII [Thermosipho affectus]|uniref:Ribonuclease HII n=1 Tax=Thermosipho affectus TaxID=660294 RepID=A0ABX3IKS3_9BACT|nr:MULTISPECIES: ribonuclease HII [Thermosipho]ANQ53132.1 ribonuclease HII [Thermosipho sp. 1070]APT71581.1 ribonuclease HII [Thermosipho sp. 1063]ONN28000.1 ribonuclease HII [Thermosipho affectus]OOC45657.1 ribonuclease HII [Thermosipho sp. 1074]